MPMQKTMLVLIAIFSLIIYLFSKNHSINPVSWEDTMLDAEKRLNSRVERLTNELELNESQQEQLRAIFASIQAAFPGELNRNRHGRQTENMPQAMVEKLRSAEQQMESILNKDQLAIHRELKHDRQKRMENVVTEKGNSV